MPSHTKRPRTKSNKSQINIGNYASIASKSTFPMTADECSSAGISSEFCYAMHVKMKFDRTNGHFFRTAFIRYTAQEVRFPILIIADSPRRITFFICSKEVIRNENKFLKGRLRETRRQARKNEREHTGRLKTESLLTAITTFHKAYAY